MSATRKKSLPLLFISTFANFKGNTTIVSFYASKTFFLHHEQFYFQIKFIVWKNQYIFLSILWFDKQNPAYVYNSVELFIYLFWRRAKKKKTSVDYWSSKLKGWEQLHKIKYYIFVTCTIFHFQFPFLFLLISFSFFIWLLTVKKYC